MIDLNVLGTEGLAALGAAVRRLSADRVIVNECAKEIRRAVPPIRAAIKENELAVLPAGNGLNRWVASARISATIRRGAKTAGVTIKQGRNSARKRSDLKRLDAGSTRHPLYGNRRHWYPQRVPAGAFTNAVTDEGVQEFRQAVVIAVGNAIEKVL